MPPNAIAIFRWNIMYQYVSKKIAQKWLADSAINIEEKEIYEYGIEIILSSLVGILLIILLGICFFNIRITLLFLLIFIPIRSYCGGYHAETYLKCNIGMLVVFICTMLIATNVKITFNAVAIILIVINIHISILSPVVNKSKPLTTSEKTNNKKRSMILSLLLSFIAISLYKYSNIATNIITVTLFMVCLLQLIAIIKNKASK